MSEESFKIGLNFHKHIQIFISNILKEILPDFSTVKLGDMPQSPPENLEDGKTPNILSVVLF